VEEVVVWWCGGGDGVNRSATPGSPGSGVTAANGLAGARTL
jgi:hypothetical protein